MESILVNFVWKPEDFRAVFVSANARERSAEGIRRANKRAKDMTKKELMTFLNKSCQQTVVNNITAHLCRRLVEVMSRSFTLCTLVECLRQIPIS
jgi:hypothetical protein